MLRLKWNRSNPNLEGFLLPFFLEGCEMVDEMILWIILFFFCSFFHYQKVKKNYLKNMQHATCVSLLHWISDMKNNTALQNIHWHCLNIQLNYRLQIYFLFLHVTIKTVSKISQFSCFHYTSPSFHAVSKTIR